MKGVSVKLVALLRVSVVIMTLVVIFGDSNWLNSLFIDNSVSFKVEEVFLSDVSNDNNSQLVQLGVKEESDANKESLVVNTNTNNNLWVWPTEDNYIITSYYGYRWGKLHGAIDISGSLYGSNIYAANSGVVVTVKGGCVAGNLSCNGRGGNYIVIKHNQDNYYTMYMHLLDVRVSVGDVVSSGQVIGAMGNTGNVVPRPTASRPHNGTHLHFALYIGEPYKGGYAVNPMRLY